MLDVLMFVIGICGGLVLVMGMCVFVWLWEGILIGLFGGMFVCLLFDVMIKFKIDDLVNCVVIYVGVVVWGMIVVVLFVE